MKMKLNGIKEVIGGIGQLKEELKPIPNTPLYNFINDFANKLIIDLQTSLQKATGGNSGSSLSQSIGQAPPAIVSVKGDVINVQIGANEYWDYVNSGVSGYVKKNTSPYSFKNPYPNRSMAKSLQAGMALKGISLPATFKDIESYAYAAATKIKRDGITPNHFVDNVINEDFINTISLSLSEEFGKQINISLTEN